MIYHIPFFKKWSDFRKKLQSHEKLNLHYKMDPPHLEANVDNPINVIQ